MEESVFLRSIRMFQAIYAAMRPGMTWNQAAIAANIGEYVSRGKGRGGGGNHSAYCVAMDQRRAAKARNKAKHRAAVRKN